MKQNIYDNDKFFDFYRELRETDDNYNVLLEQPAMKKLLPDLSDKCVLDLGCGFGNNCMDFVNLGAKSVTGIDISENMLGFATIHNSHSNISYINMPLEDLDKHDGKYDFIYSSLCFHYIENFDKLIKDVYSLLNKGGILLFSQEHPIATASSDLAGNYLRNEDNIPFSYCINDYQLEGIRSMEWFVDGVIKYHRTLSTVINTLCNNGFIVKKVIEPVPDKTALEKRSSLMKEFIKPCFLIVKAEKI